jgi:hypothetical protein
MEGNATRLATCPDFEDLSCFIDDELDVGRLGTVREHVESCDRCASLTARLQQAFDGTPGGGEGGLAGVRCSDEEGLILYLMRGLSAQDRVAIETHLAHCDSCVYGISLLRKRLRIEDCVDRAVPSALRQKVREVIEAGAREIAEQHAVDAARPAPPALWLHRVRDHLDRFLRLPVLVPAAVAAGALLVIGVQNQGIDGAGPERSGIRAIERVSTLRVTAARAVVRREPRASGATVAELKAGEQVQVAGEERDWYRVLLSDEQSGWVEREAFE